MGLTVMIGGIVGTDVSVSPSSLTFTTQNWGSEQTVTVTDGDDDDAVDDAVTLTHAVSSYGSVTSAPSVDVAVADDAPLVAVSFGESTYSVAEGASVIVSVTLDADPGRTVTVPLDTANLDGASGVDYSRVPASVVFASGDTSESFTFVAVSDSVDDDGESVGLSFGTLPAGVTAGGRWKPHPCCQVMMRLWKVDEASVLRCRFRSRRPQRRGPLGSRRSSCHCEHGPVSEKALGRHDVVESDLDEQGGDVGGIDHGETVMGVVIGVLCSPPLIVGMPGVFEVLINQHDATSASQRTSDLRRRSVDVDPMVHRVDGPDGIN